MKTILQALKDELSYPFDDGFIENKLLARGLYPEENMIPDDFQSPQYQGAIADCLYALITAPNFSESDISISLPDRNFILKMANDIYASIGEEPKSLGQPKVRIGFA